LPGAGTGCVSLSAERVAGAVEYNSGLAAVEETSGKSKYSRKNDRTKSNVSPINHLLTPPFLFLEICSVTFIPFGFWIGIPLICIFPPRNQSCQPKIFLGGERRQE